MSKRYSNDDHRSYRRPAASAGDLTDRRETWVGIYTLLAEGLKHPDDRLHRDVREERFADELARHADELDIPLPVEPGDPTHAPETRAAFDSEYIALFEGLATPYAPLVESVYRPWRAGWSSDGLLSGPAASDMRDRYDAAGVSIPDAYEADHLALLLEYAAALLQSGADAAYRTFVDQHLDWLPALRRLVDDAAADAPFHRYCVVAVCETVATARRRQRLPAPEPEQIDEQVDRASTHVE